MLVLEGFHIFHCSLAEYDFASNLSYFQEKYQIKIPVHFPT